MNIYKILQKKRDKFELSNDEIEYFISSVLKGEISNEQIAALLMAICINGMTENEAISLTRAMLHSGELMDFHYIGKPVVDKHSTGGVGDKISLILMPILLSFDLCVPMISGRGLGHTGGTIDKLESISGYKVELSNDELKHQMEQIGGAIIAQSENIAPADKIIYSIRDITATVESDALITASILSKKLAEGIDCLVLDLKIGNGAFYQSIDKAQTFIKYMTDVANSFDIKFKIIPTDMSSPLGYYIGNWLEVVETQNCLRGEFSNDLKTITYELASELLLLSGKFAKKSEALSEIDNVISKGLAYDNFLRWIAFQGGNLNQSEKDYANTPIYIIRAPFEGKIKAFNTKEIGFAAIELGAGRKKPSDTLDYSAGIKLLKKVGDTCQKDETIAILYARNTSKFELTEFIFNNAIEWERA